MRSQDLALRWLLKPAVWGLCLLPLALVLPGLIEGEFPNPVEELTHVTGEWGLRLFLLTLAMRPLRELIQHPWPLRLRRLLGLFTFFYASLHMLTWAWLDQGWELQAIVDDIIKRPYITVGFLVWLGLLPLALTSTRWAMRYLGKRWGQLHRLVYLLLPLAVLHYFWSVKADWLDPVIYALITLLLLAVRMPAWRAGLQRRWAGG